MFMIGETRFPEAFLGIDASAGFEGVDGEGLRSRNRARLEALEANGDVKASICSANVSFPPHQGRRVSY